MQRIYPEGTERMAATESRTGFRLPWSSEDKANGQRADEPQDADRPADVEPTETHDAEEAPTAEAATSETTSSRPRGAVRTGHRA